MDQRGDEIHTSSTEATGASKEGVVRWVLLIGLVLVVVFLSAIWITGALTQDEADSHQNVGREIGAQQDDQTDVGEPLPPAFEDATISDEAAAPGASAPVEPTGQATPGDAPAGDPRPQGQ